MESGTSGEEGHGVRCGIDRPVAVRRRGSVHGGDRGRPAGPGPYATPVPADTINAKTGIPLGIAISPAGKVIGTITYVVTRVNLASIAAGKF